tara:strand:+ start:55 stop:663 length:609 start_codon:yes stop_codon:yes gene_type:complete
MSVPVFQATIVNGSGDLLPAATITVIVEGSGTPATLFSDRNGTVPLGTLGVFSVDAEAFAQFFAAPGNYRVTANDSGSGFSRTWDYVVLTGTAATADTGLLTGNVPTADDLSMVGQTINWTGANFRPDEEEGANARFILFNQSGSSILPNDLVSGSILASGIFLTSGVIFNTANTMNASFTFKNVGRATIAPGEANLFSRNS